MGSSFSLNLFSPPLQHNPPSPIEVIYIEGNIGCGKSSVLSYLQELGEITVPESVSDWSFLDTFYKDYSCAFQLQTEIALSRRTHLYNGIKAAQHTNKQRLFVERSVKTGALFSEGISPQENVVLNNLYTTLSSQHVKFFTEKTIYISTDPSVCQERIKTRNRTSEHSIDNNYLCRLHTIFESHFNSLPNTLILTPHKSVPASEIALHILDEI